MANLYIVATPIGNLEDMTLRAIRILKSVHIVLCEDTRTTKVLFDHYGISTRTLSYHSKSGLNRTQEIVSLLKEGNDLALVSDAGTPCISDPGSQLITIIRRECKEEINNGNIKIVSIPGASALVSALSIAGVDSSQFTFLGFLPHKKGRQTIFNLIKESSHTIVFYESPHRIIKTLLVLRDLLDEDRIVSICRELTKVYEEVIQGTAREVFDYFENNKEKVRGEFVVIVSNK